MKIIFDSTNDFYKDLDNVIARLDRFNNPLVVVPEEKDVKNCEKRYEDSHVSFISYDYWLSKKWAGDGYDHIDFFRIDQFFMSRSFRIPVGVGTMRRMVSKKKVEKEEE
jgi:hypothetical protein